MKTAERIMLVFTFVLLAFTSPVMAQSASTTNYFPYVSNGYYAPGSAYEKFTMQAVNPSAQPATCYFMTMGEDNQSYHYFEAFAMVPNGGTFSITSPGKSLPYSAAVASVSCNVPIFTHINYQIFDSNDQLISFTSMSPVIPTITTEFHYPENPGMLWINIAYDHPGTFPTILDVTLDDESHVSSTITVQGLWSNKVGNMLENYVSIPPGRTPVNVKISSVVGLHSVDFAHPLGDAQAKFIAGSLNALGFTYISNPPAPLL